jgi:uncharacterized protein YwqG
LYARAGRNSGFGVAMENMQESAPICPKCKKSMQPGRAKVAGYPYLQSFECWPCLEVVSEATDKR